jgi:hypothetical protein
MPGCPENAETFPGYREAKAGTATRAQTLFTFGDTTNLEIAVTSVLERPPSAHSPPYM